MPVKKGYVQSISHNLHAHDIQKGQKRPTMLKNTYGKTSWSNRMKDHNPPIKDKLSVTIIPSKGFNLGTYLKSPEFLASLKSGKTPKGVLHKDL